MKAKWERRLFLMSLSVDFEGGIYSILKIRALFLKPFQDIRVHA
jgi:hypothetical protein